MSDILHYSLLWKLRQSEYLLARFSFESHPPSKFNIQCVNPSVSYIYKLQLYKSFLFAVLTPCDRGVFSFWPAIDFIVHVIKMNSQAFGLSEHLQYIGFSSKLKHYYHYIVMSCQKVVFGTQEPGAISQNLRLSTLLRAKQLESG